MIRGLRDGLGWLLSSFPFPRQQLVNSCLRMVSNLRDDVAEPVERTLPFIPGNSDKCIEPGALLWRQPGDQTAMDVRGNPGGFCVAPVSEVIGI